MIKTSLFIATTLLLAACSSDDNGSSSNPVDDASTGDASNGSGGAKGSGGAGTGGKAGGAGGMATGGGSSGGASSGGTTGDASAPDGSTPDGATPGTDASDAGAQCILLDITTCNTGVLIKDSCPAGRVVASLRNCTDASTYVPDAAYQLKAVQTCDDNGCATNLQHTVWRQIECCYPGPASDAGEAGAPADAGDAATD